ncbi:MAG: peptidylprolyl isomerase [Breznakibacter sp.]|nr:peptidylprolyl isomerase [Breznakibacter sp.]
MNLVRNFCFLIFFSLSLGVQAQTNVIDEVIAIVGDNAILRSEIERQYQQMLMEGVNYSGDLKCHLLEQSLVAKLMVNQAVLDSITVNEVQVNNEAESRVNYFVNQIGSKEKVEEYFGKSMMQIKNDQKVAIREQMFAQKMNSEITKDIAATPSEVRYFYKNIPTDSLPMIATKYEIKQIVVQPAVDQKEIDRVKAQLRDFQTQVNEGRDFATLAVLYSEDPGSAANGGDLGWMTKGQLVPEFANVAFNMQEVGKVSKVVETEYGFHIIQLIEKKDDRIHVRHILMKPQVNQKSMQEAYTKLDTIAKGIAQSKYTFEVAAQSYSDDKDSRMNGGSMVNYADQSSRFEISSIATEINKAIQGLQEQQVSKPFKMVNDKGKDVYKIVKLDKKLAPHRANLTDDYQVIQNMLIAKKKRDAVNKWINDRQAETYIRINQNWSNCDWEYNGWVTK